jgi:ethanolamine utilization protein EutP (predicted NTPase)
VSPSQAAGSNISKSKPLPRPTPPAVLAAVNAANNTSNAFSPRPAAGLTKKKIGIAKFDLPAWEHSVMSEVLKITLDVGSMHRLLTIWH